MYDHQLYLRKASAGSWAVVNKLGMELHTFIRAATPSEAMELAKAWASSWSSVEIIYEDEKENRDRVSSST